MNLLRLVLLLAALPGRLLVRWIDGRKRSNGVPPLGAFLRGCVHTFVWLAVVMAVSMAMAPPAPAPAPTRPVTRPMPRYVPPPIPSGVLPPRGGSTPTTSPTTVEHMPRIHLEEDDDDHDGEGWFCRRRKWC